MLNITKHFREVKDEIRFVILQWNKMQAKVRESHPTQHESQSKAEVEQAPSKIR